MILNTLELQDITQLESLLLKDGIPIPVTYNAIKDIPQNTISLFCLKHACYQIITTELIDFLKQETSNDKTIEIGSGNGTLGRALGITMTDSFMQNRHEVKAFYEQLKQPTITYGKDVIKMEALDAVNWYKPHTVIGCWVTQKWKEGFANGSVWGVAEDTFKGKIKKYIVIGNDLTHGDKEIRSLFPFKTYRFPWLVSRSQSKEKNAIYIFDCQ